MSICWPIYRKTFKNILTIFTKLNSKLFFLFALLIELWKSFNIFFILFFIINFYIVLFIFIFNFFWSFLNFVIWFCFLMFWVNFLDLILVLRVTPFFCTTLKWRILFCIFLKLLLYLVILNTSSISIIVLRVQSLLLHFEYFKIEKFKEIKNLNYHSA